MVSNKKRKEIKKNYILIIMNTNFCAGNCNSNVISIIVPGRNPETVINEGNGIVSTIVQNPQTVSNIVVAANGEVFTGDSGGKYFLF